MATIKLAVVSIIINSSYVLIITTPSTRLEAGGERPPSCPGKHIMLSFFATNEGGDFFYFSAYIPMTFPISTISLASVNSNRTFPSPLKYISSSLSKSNTPAVSTEKTLIFEYGKDV